MKSTSKEKGGGTEQRAPCSCGHGDGGEGAAAGAAELAEGGDARAQDVGLGPGGLPQGRHLRVIEDPEGVPWEKARGQRGGRREGRLCVGLG